LREIGDAQQRLLRVLTQRISTRLDAEFTEPVGAESPNIGIALSERGRSAALEVPAILLLRADAEADAREALRQRIKATRDRLLFRTPPPRPPPPATLAPLSSTTPLDRAGHAYGKSFRDVVRALRRDFAHPPDVVAFPRTEDEVTAVLDWCTSANAAVIPYGGGSSVVGGVEPAVGARYAGAVSLDLSRLDRVLEVDRTSRAARIQAGVLGPALE